MLIKREEGSFVGKVLAIKELLSIMHKNELEQIIFATLAVLGAICLFFALSNPDELSGTLSSTDNWAIQLPVK